MSKLPGWLGVAAALGGAFACSQSEPVHEGLGEQRVELVGAAQTISASAHTNDFTSVGQNTRVACGAGAPCVAIYTQGNVLVGRRFDANGPIDTDTVVLGHVDNDYPLRIVAGSSGEYLITWGYGSVSAVRFNALTGEVSAPLNLSGLGDISNVQALAATTKGYVIVYSNGSIKAARLENGTLKDTKGFVLAPAGGAGAKGSGSQVGIATTAGFVRFDAQQGKVLDATPIVFDKWATTTDYYNAAGVAFDGTNYLLVYPHGDQMYSVRIKASDGSLLDVPDDFNEKPGGHQIAEGSGHANVWFDGTNYVALWSENTALEGVRLTKGGIRVDSSVAAYEFYLGSIGSNPDAGFDSGHGLVSAYSTNGVWSKIAGLRLSATQGNAPQATTQAISFNGTNHEAFSVASNDADFLVAYRAAEEGKLYVRAVDGLTGKALGPQRTLSDYSDNTYAGTDKITLAWSGKFYIAVWRQGNSTYYRLVHCDGTPYADQPVLLGAGEGGRVACNDDRCAITWRKGDLISIKRLDAQTGTLLDSTAVTISPSKTVYRGPEIATDGTPAASQRTFMVIWSTADGVYGQRLRSQGALVSATTIQSIAGVGEELQIASDGAGFLSTWRVNKQLYARPIDPATGAVKGASVVTLPFNVAWQSSLSFDGSSFLTTWMGYDDGVLRANRLDAAAVNLDATGEAINPVQPYVVNASANGSRWGRSLVVHTVEDNPSFSLLVAARTYDNALGPGSKARTFTCPGAGGSGGAGGGGGTGGDGGTTVGGAFGSGGTGVSGGIGGDTDPAAGGASGGRPEQGEGGIAHSAAGEPSMGGDANVGAAGGAESAVAGSAASDAGATADPDTSGGGTSAVAGGAATTDPTTAGSKDSSGCGCRVAAAPSTSFAPLLALALAGVLARRRSARPAHALVRSRRRELNPAPRCLLTAASRLARICRRWRTGCRR